jgi:hypothetical protein
MRSTHLPLWCGPTAEVIQGWREWLGAGNHLSGPVTGKV